jgi:hypothetical protein
MADEWAAPQGSALGLRLLGDGLFPRARVPAQEGACRCEREHAGALVLLLRIPLLWCRARHDILKGVPLNLTALRWGFRVEASRMEV